LFGAALFRPDPSLESFHATVGAVPMTSEETAAQIRSSGLRATASRVAIYRAVCEIDGGHPTVGQVVERVRVGAGSASMQAVYDGLQALASAGMLRRIEPAGSPARYETRVGDNHHHVICRSCGLTRDVDCATELAPCLDPADVAGFVVDEAEITFWGLCPDCKS
jgi:Fe2+ or Zn2+ uptake regulation protein